MTRQHRRFGIGALALAAMIFLAACGRVELYQNLTEEDANEILVLLSENGLKPVKKRVLVQNEVSYAVEVPESQMVTARALLLKNHLPRRKELGLTGVYKEKGLIPTPDEQKARFLLALKGEIINSLERIPQVVDADVVLNIPVKDEFADAEKQKLQRPTASVVVRVKPEASGLEVITEPKIQQFVANAVEGMNPRDVTVMISYIAADERMAKAGDVKSLPSQQLPGAFGTTQAPGLGGQMAQGAPPAIQQELLGLKLDNESKERLRTYILVFFLILVVLSVALIVVIIQGSRMRRTLAALQGPAGQHPAIEGQILEEGPPKLNDGLNDEL